jgi:hypothetical protein
VIEMTEMRARFHRADNLQPPELWTEVLLRAAAAPTRSAPAWAPSPSFRLVLLLVGLLILASAAILAVGSLPRTPRPVRPAALETGWIAYSVGDPRQAGRGDLYLTRLRGTPRRIIGSDADGLEQACPTFSPDGSLLAYGERVEDSDGGSDPLASETDASVVVVALGGDGVPTERLRISAGKTDRLPCPQWAPDGSSVAFIAGDRGLDVVPLSGQAVDLNVLASSFSWAHDSSAIVVANERLVQIVSTGGTASRTLWQAPSDDRRPAWLTFVAVSPVEPVVAIGIEGIGAEGIPSRALRIVNHENGEVVLELPGEPDPWSTGRPAWSPDGGSLAWETADGIVVRSIRGAANAIRGGPWAMAGTGSLVHTAQAGVSWSPGGNRLLFVGFYGRTAFTDGPLYAFVSIAATGPANPLVHSPWTDELYWASQEDITWQAVYE